MPSGLRMTIACCVLLGCLTSCFTMRMWTDLPRSQATRTTTPAVQVERARLLTTRDGSFLCVDLRVGERPVHASTWRIDPRSGDVVVWAVQRAASTRLALEIRRFPFANVQNEWQATLVVTDHTGDTATVSLQPSATDLDLSTAHAIPLTLHEVTCIEVDLDAHSSVDTLAVTWRVLATPFVVAADLVLAVPLGVVLGVIALTDPALLTGG